MRQGQEKYSKNENYNLVNFNRIYNNYCEAKQDGNRKLAKNLLTQITEYIQNYVYSELWTNYPTLMANSQHREDIVQTVWVKIYDELDRYDYQKGAITTFIAPWIRHAVSDYCSKTFKNTSVYYSAAMRDVQAAINCCNSHSAPVTNETICKLSGLSSATVNRALDLLIKTDKVSYDTLTEVSREQESKLGCPEETFFRNQQTDTFNKFLESKLSEEELRVIRHLVSPNDSHKKNASYREVAEKMKSNVPYVKEIISKIIIKIKSDETLCEAYPDLIYMYTHEDDENVVPILDDDAFIQEEVDEFKKEIQIELSFLKDI